jgi:hypothetical protein
MWRLSQRGEVQEGYPVPFQQLFWKLPKYITKIDAVYQRETDGSIVLFTGKIPTNSLLLIFNSCQGSRFPTCETN